MKKIGIIGSNNNNNIKKLIDLLVENPEKIEIVVEDEDSRIKKLAQNAVLDYEKKMKIPEELLKRVRRK